MPYCNFFVDLFKMSKYRARNINFIPVMSKAKHFSKPSMNLSIALQNHVKALIET